MNNIELLKERQHLDETLGILNDEILNYIEKRKKIAEYILDYRKQAIEDYKDDEDKLIEYFDHERYVKEESYKTIDRKLAEFTKLKENPYFGKVVIEEEGFGEDELYVGRYGLIKEGSYEATVVDWRAPIASLFYKGKLGEATYTSPEGDIDVDIKERRQFQIKNGDLIGCFDSAVDVKDEILQMVLSSSTGDKLKDIVMTIQGEQDSIIREPRNKAVVVDGVAGSGKTTIALHRVAYLLYNNREFLTDKVLILGPNDIFMDYISNVLPTLGEEGFSNDTFTSFGEDVIGLDEKVIDFTYYLEEALKGNKELRDEIIYKSSPEFIAELDGLVNKLEESYFHIKPVKFVDEEIVCVDEINELFEKHYKYMPLFKRAQKIKMILTLKIKDKRDEKIRELNKEIQEKVDKLTEEELLVEKTNIEYQRKIRIREIVREVMNARDELDTWVNPESTLYLYKKFTGKNELSYLDIAPIIYLMIKLEGKKLKKEIKHIVIDEAQDYSMLQFIVLKELTGCRSFTIVGDSNQRIIKTEEIPAMLRLKEILGSIVKEYKLDKSYRSTYQIMEYANKLLKTDSVVPFVREGKFDVKEHRLDDKEDLIQLVVALLEDFDELKYENVAVITRGREELELIAPEIKKHTRVMTFDRSDMLYKGGKVIVPSYYAKGLEFDGVIVIDFNNKNEDLIEYIMCTRALHKLDVIKYNEK